ncbi:glucokinase [Thermosporothrix hazakensis]|jgi:glucokinase|uniref:Glucokinase n=1 Tax=Thermosporothrix hazakensis TaxID=644383 RepID=A0A326U692_THEHA|nr:glucokinase [Thermosporothrix hazakensis]PZW29481.1 glucokinase [Thermosporothrix hazakensis]GCE45804.1 glucokinase [Thermosporothrix hazakensis]
MLLAGDIGGTKANLAIFASPDTLRTPVAQMKLRCNQYSSMAELVRDFLKQVGGDYTFTAACFGVAGPVLNNKANITNLPWSIDADELEKELQIPHVFLLNDLEAIAAGVPLLHQDELYCLNEGTPVEHGTLGVVAPGTGLGEAFLTYEDGGYRSHATEGGHASFAPITPEQLELLRFLMQKLPHVSFEMVCSGIGLPNIYDYLKSTGRYEEPSWLTEALASAKDRTPVIVQAAQADKAVQLCVETVRMFVSILGAEAGNMALKVLATGGIYIGGGVPCHILPFMKESTFMEAFKHKGRFSGLLARIPVQVILTSEVGLIGAAHFGFTH